MTDGSEFETKSTWGKENDVLKTRHRSQITLGLDWGNSENIR